MIVGNVTVLDEWMEGRASATERRRYLLAREC